nr:alpha/beta hydrolase [Ensifer sp. ENS09]
MVVANIGRHRSIEEIASALLVEVPFDRFSICGLSMGGIVAMEMIRQSPQRIMSAALLDTTPLADAAGRDAVRDRQVAEARKGGLQRVFVEEMLPFYLGSLNEKDESLRRSLEEMAMDLGVDVFENQSVALRDRRNSEDALRSYRGRVLVLCGEEDALCPIDRHRMIVGACNFSELVTLPGIGHISTLEAPDLVNAQLRRWLSTTAQTERDCK